MEFREYSSTVRIESNLTCSNPGRSSLNFPKASSESGIPRIRKLISALPSTCDTTPILEAMLSTGTGYVVCPAETNQEAFMAIMARYSDVTVRVNMDSGVMSRGRSDEIRAEIRRSLGLKP